MKYLSINFKGTIAKYDIISEYDEDLVDHLDEYDCIDSMLFYGKAWGEKTDITVLKELKCIEVCIEHEKYATVTVDDITVKEVGDEYKEKLGGKHCIVHAYKEAESREFVGYHVSDKEKFDPKKLVIKHIDGVGYILDDIQYGNKISGCLCIGGGYGAPDRGKIYLY